jgi:hypothetical protein
LVLLKFHMKFWAAMSNIKFFHNISFWHTQIKLQLKCCKINTTYISISSILLKNRTVFFHIWPKL